MSTAAISGQPATPEPEPLLRVIAPAARGIVPWYIWAGVIAVTSSTIGLEWDISWHRSIGRDTFWTPAHMMIYFCGVLSAVVCGYLVLASTFGNSRELRDSSVTVYGLRAPLGCMVATWGGLAMLVSAPFDNWWHGAYGLDVQILSPPHTLLFMGLRLIAVGFLLQIAGTMNRAAAAGEQSRGLLMKLFLYMGGLIVVGQMLLVTQRVEQPLLHNSAAYKGMAIALMMVLVFVSQVSGYRWAATSVSAIYMVGRLAELWIFPLFPATPKLGPVVNPITHLMPAQFPILIVVPAILLDLFWQRAGASKPEMKLWLNACLSGVIFTASMTAVEWPFADFLASKYAENRFFGTMYFDYSARLMDRTHQFAFVQGGGTLARGLIVATLEAALMCWIGLHLGRWARMLER